MQATGPLLQNLQLRDFQNRHAGQRCFIVGNGPSLSSLPLDRLQNELLFGSNRGYLAYPLGLPTFHYYCLSDIHVFNKHREEIVRAQVGERFYRDTAVPPEVDGWRVPYLPDCYMYHGDFRKDISTGTARGHTVTLDLCVPIAFYMGFETVILIGCDYAWARDSVHFYQCPRDAQTQIDALPVDRMFKSFEVARRTFEEEGRQLLNATSGGNLEALKRVAFDSLF